MVRTCSAGRSRTGLVIIPAWQNRQPRVQPRNTSTESRSWTTSVSGASGRFGYGHSPRSATVRLCTTDGTSGYTRTDRHETRAVELDVVHGGRVHAGDLGQRPQTVSRDPSVRPERLPLPDDLVDLPDDLFTFTEHRQIDEIGQRFGIERRVATHDHERILRSPLGGADRDARQVQAVEEVGVHQLRREVERHDVEITRRPVGVDREVRHPVAPQQLLEIGPGRVGPLGHCIVTLVEDLVQDLQTLVGQPDLVGVGIRQQPAHLARPVRRFDGPILATDVPGRSLDLAQERLESRPQGLWSL